MKHNTVREAGMGTAMVILMAAMFVEVAIVTVAYAIDMAASLREEGAR